MPDDIASQSQERCDVCLQNGVSYFSPRPNKDGIIILLRVVRTFSSCASPPLEVPYSLCREKAACQFPHLDWENNKDDDDGSWFSFEAVRIF